MGSNAAVASDTLEVFSLLESCLLTYFWSLLTVLWHQSCTGLSSMDWCVVVIDDQVFRPSLEVGVVIGPATGQHLITGLAVGLGVGLSLVVGYNICLDMGTSLVLGFDFGLAVGPTSGAGLTSGPGLGADLVSGLGLGISKGALLISWQDLNTFLITGRTQGAGLAAASSMSIDLDANLGSVLVSMLGLDSSLDVG